MTAPALLVPVRTLRSHNAGQRPGDGTYRALTDGELFVNLADRVQCYLDASGTLVTYSVDPNKLALLASPAFTGAPTAPTQAAGDNSTSLATTAYADRAASTAQMVAVGNAPVKSVVGQTGAITLTQLMSGGVAPLASPALTGTPTAPTQTAGDSSTKVATTAYADRATLTNPSADGCCRLSVASSTALLLSPLTGNTLWVGGQACTIPSGGVPLSGQTGLNAGTLYYVYATASAGVVNALVLSTTGHIAGSDGRHYLSSGGATPSAVTTSRLVGMVWTNTASAPFIDNATNRWCLNWFNRRQIQAYVSFGGSQTTSTSYAILSGGVSVLAWPDEAVAIGIAGYASSTLSAGIATTVYVDGSQYGPQSAAASAAPNSAVNIAMAYTLNVGEALHSYQPYGQVSAGTGTWQAALSVLTRG